MTFAEAMELWAIWIARGRQTRKGFHSQLHMMIVTRCEFSGSSGYRDDGIPVDCIEAEIEAGLLRLRLAKPDQAEVVIAAYCWPGTDTEKSDRLDMPLRTFGRQKRAGRLFLLRHLAERRGGHWKTLLSTENVRKL